MGVMITSSIDADVGGSGFSSSWFSDRDQASGGDRLNAVVLWRGMRNTTAKPFPWGLMILNLILPRALMKRVLLKWFLPSEMHGPGDSWTSSSGEGENEVRYDRRRNVVGIRSRTFGPPPAGHTLVLFVESDASAPDGIRVTEHALVVPPAEPRPHIDRESLPRAEVARQMSAVHRARQNAWTQALEADPRYAQFMRGPRSAAE